jgi:hypothetical protein
MEGVGSIPIETFGKRPIFYVKSIFFLSLTPMELSFGCYSIGARYKKVNILSAAELIAEIEADHKMFVGIITAIQVGVAVFDTGGNGKR